MATKDDLSLQELLVLNSETRNLDKSLALCYILLLGGHLGAHRFYLKRYKSAIIQLLLFILAMVGYIVAAITAEVSGINTMFVVFTVFFIITVLPLTVWVIIDLFVIPKMVREWNAKVEHDLIAQIVQMRR